jgi:D-sedoheptulose 7-phosphate isomerase
MPKYHTAEDRLSDLLRIAYDMSEDGGLIYAISQVGDYLRRTLQAGRKVFICGNGGSFTQALHFAAEFVRDYNNVTALMSNAASMTAMANDIDYNEVFAQQVRVQGNAGDCLIALTTSGHSPNVINAMRVACKNDIGVILLTGSAPHYTAIENCHWQIRVPSKDTPLIQELHLNILHTWMKIIQGEKK